MKKLIDVPDNLVKPLNIKAARNDTNPKNYIEDLIVSDLKPTNQFTDEELRLLLSLVSSRMLKNVGSTRTFQSLGKLNRKLTNLITK